LSLSASDPLLQPLRKDFVYQVGNNKKVKFSFVRYLRRLSTYASTAICFVRLKFGLSTPQAEYPTEIFDIERALFGGVARGGAVG